MAFAKNVKRLRELHGISQVELAKIAGVTDKAVSTWENGVNEPRMGAVQRIADHFGLLKSNLLEEDGMRYVGLDADDGPPSIFTIPGILPIQTKRIPLLGEIACGVPVYADEHFEGYVECGAGIHADFALKAKGDSMINARILDGDIVFVRRQSTVEPGEIAVVVVGEEATLKRFRRQGRLAILSPENPNYEPIVVDLRENDSVYILGKAIAFQSDVR